MRVGDFSFRSWMESVVVDFHGVSGRHINPDDIWEGCGSGSVTFVYTDNKIYFAKDGVGLKNNSPHIAFFMLIPDLRNKIKGDANAHVSFEDARRYRLDKGLDECLFGRYMNCDITFARRYGLRGGTGIREFDGTVNIISFWNMDQPIYDLYLDGCIKAILSYEMFDTKNLEGGEEPTLISTPLLGTRYLGDVVKGVMSSGLSDEDKERIAMHQRLHLAGPAEKRELMDKLGLVAVSDRDAGRKKWRDEMMKIGKGPYFHQSEWFNMGDN